MSGRFISFEGSEGVGKTTAIARLNDYLQQRRPVLCTREPGGSAFAERLRALLLDPATTIDDDTELLLLFAARRDHLQQVILPALARGQWVLCDRFTDSTVAYQGFARAHGDPAVLAKIERLMDDFVPRLPDVTFWLDLEVNTGLERAQNRSQADRFEQQQLDFFRRVQQGFAYMAAQAPERIYRIDAAADIDTIQARLQACLAV